MYGAGVLEGGVAADIGRLAGEPGGNEGWGELARCEAADPGRCMCCGKPDIA